MTDVDRLDIIEGADESGDPILLRVERYFYYNGQEYVLLQQVENQDDDSQDDGDARLYVMAVQVSLDDDGEEIEDFVPIEPDLMASLIKTARVTFKADLGEGDSSPLQ
ncbi:MAG: DUF1292 domain-containing protein [Clostridiales bacterium]|nr:DUF1292 domain-containing protein [Clostridiales bacterium]